jgi:tripartite ATP-independent transporter DctM subunit
MLFIIYGASTQTSIGWLFMAGLIPGLLLIGMYMILIAFIAKIRPNKIPKIERASRKDALAATPGMLYLIMVFAVVIGGIYIGVFSPTEAGSFGVAAVFIIGVIRKKLSFRMFLLSMREAAVTLGMIGMILAGAMILQRLIVVTGITRQITQLISGAGNSVLTFFLISGILLVVLGCFIDALPLMMLMGPLLLPIAVNVGIDPVHFGVFVVTVMLIGNLTPPVGMAVYVLAGVVPDVPMAKIFKGVMPFVIVMVIFLFIVSLFPSLSLWLPSTMLG